MLTPEQIQSARAKLGLNVAAVGANPSAGSAPTQSPTGLKGGDLVAWANSVNAPEVVEQPKKTADDYAKETIDNTIQGYKNIDEMYHSGKIGIGEMALHKVGETIGGLTDLVMSPIKAIGPKKKGSEQTDTKIPNLQEKLSTWLADPKITTYENAGKLAKQAGDLMVQAHQEADPEKKKKIIALANEVSNTAKQVQSKADEIDADLKVAEQRANTTINVGGAFLGTDAPVSEVSSAATKTAAKIATAAKPVVTAVEDAASTVAKKAAVKSEAKAFSSSVDDAQKVLNPTGYYTQAEKQAALKSGETKIKGKGVFKKEVISPKANQQVDTISQLIREGSEKVKNGEAKTGDVLSPNNLPSQNINHLNREARITDSNIDEFVNKPELNKPFTQQVVDKNLKNLSTTAKDNLTFVADSTEEKAYNEVIKLAKQEVAKQSYNSAGLRKAIKSFNARMEKILGNDIYGDASESIGKARLQAAKDTRLTLNKMLADNLESPIIKKGFANEKVANKLPSSSEYNTGRKQGGSVYHHHLQREAQLLNAKDEISYRGSKSIDKTKVKQYFDKHPAVKKAAKTGALIIGGGVLGGSLLHNFGL